MKAMLSSWMAIFMAPWQDYIDFKGQVDSERTYQVLIVAPSVRVPWGAPLFFPAHVLLRTFPLTPPPSTPHADRGLCAWLL